MEWLVAKIVLGMFDLAAVQEWLTAIQSLVTILAITVGGIWGYKLYRQNREKAPRAEISVHLSSRPITLKSKKYTLLHLKVVIHNRGKVLLKVNDGFIRINQIDPLPPGFNASALRKSTAQETRGPAFDWPLIAEQRGVYAKEEESAIEPTLKDELVADMLLEVPIKRIGCYAYIGKKVGKDSIGWGKNIHYDVQEGKVLL